MDSSNLISTLSNPAMLHTNSNSKRVSVSLYRDRYTTITNKNKTTSTRVESRTCKNSFQKFIHFALDQTRNRTRLVPSPLQDKYSSIIATDGKTELQMLSFEAPKIRFLRSLSIENDSMQVLDLAVLPKPKFDLPIFCANFFTTSNLNIVVLDLNPLYDVTDRVDYKEKYYKHLMPLIVEYTKVRNLLRSLWLSFKFLFLYLVWNLHPPKFKVFWLNTDFMQLLPWGGKLTSESLRFFSPIVIWTKFSPSQDNYDALYSAFVDYYKAWLDMMDQAAEETNISQILTNSEAQHKYLTWRTEKDPGHQVLKKLIGDARAKDLVKNFLFNGIDDLGTKTFLDYFPEYECENGMINEKRSVIGKSFEHRPWNSTGDFVADKFR